MPTHTIIAWISIIEQLTAELIVLIAAIATATAGESCGGSVNSSSNSKRSGLGDNDSNDDGDRGEGDHEVKGENSKVHQNINW